MKHMDDPEWVFVFIGLFLVFLGLAVLRKKKDKYE